MTTSINDCKFDGSDTLQVRSNQYDNDLITIARIAFYKEANEAARV